MHHAIPRPRTGYQFLDRLIDTNKMTPAGRRIAAIAVLRSAAFLADRLKAEVENAVNLTPGSDPSFDKVLASTASVASEITDLANALALYDQGLTAVRVEHDREARGTPISPLGQAARGTHPQETAQVPECAAASADSAALDQGGSHAAG